jgi:hypothetical protein
MNNVLQQPTLDKENIPFQVALASTTRKPTRVKKGPNAYLKGKWIDQQLEKAMNIVEGGLTSLKKAYKH